MPRIKTTDKMLQAVLSDPKLRELGHFEDVECLTVEEALVSDNYVIKAVGLIIDRSRANASDNEIYREVSEFLKSNI